MRFLIERATARDQKPCEEAFLDDCRFCSEEGKGWFVEVDDIMAFARKYGEIIVNPDFCGVPMITIYDGYIE